MNPKDREKLNAAIKDLGAEYEARHARSSAKADNVNHPAHYQTHIEGLETIDLIYAVLGPERFEAYCRGNALKYLARADAKGNTIEDLEKAIVYLKWEIQFRKKEAIQK